MALLAVSLDRKSMNGEVTVKIGFSAIHIFLYTATSLFCMAAVAAAEKNVRHAIGYTIFAHLTNLIQFSLWESKSQLQSGNSHEDSFSITSSSKNCKVKFSIPSLLQQTVFLYLVCIASYLGFAFTVKHSILVAFGLVLIGLRSNVALARLGFPLDKIGDSRLFKILGGVTGLELCRVICSSPAGKLHRSDEQDNNCEDWEKILLS